MNNEFKIEARTQLLLILMCCLNLCIILFISGVVGYTLNEIITMNTARDFLSTLGNLPITPPFKSMYLSIGGYLFFLIILYISEKRGNSELTLSFLFIIELILCVLISYFLNFSSNALLLLFISNVMFMSKSMENRLTFLTLGILAYLFCNSDMMSGMSIIALSDYISVYNSNLQVILFSINTILSTLNIILFIVFMFLLIQREVNDSKRVQKLNDELQILNEQLQEYALLQEKMGETKERNRLAREIHDTLGHTLTGLSMGIDAAIMILDVDSEATKKQLSVLSDTARQGLKDVRRSVEKLRPDALERYSLQEALERMINDFNSVSRVRITFTCHLEKIEFDPDIEEVIYRIVQEGMTNAVRHGRAKHIFISLAKEYNNLILIIEDDGIGSKEITFGFGLHHMNERLDKLNGTLRAYGHDGFIILAEIPLRKEIYG